MQDTLKSYQAPSVEQLEIAVERGFIDSDPSSTLNETIPESDLEESSEDFWG